jgi:hypothetical protein
LEEILDCVLVFLIWKVDGEFTFGFEAYFLRNANKKTTIATFDSLSLPLSLTHTHKCCRLMLKNWGI